MRFIDKKILGYGAYVPSVIKTNYEISETVSTTHEWIRDHLGIHERRIAVDDSVAYMGYMAAVNALLRHSINKDEIDAVIVSCSSTSHLAPSVSCQIINMLGITVPAFDLNAVCSGFVYSLELACTMLDKGGYNKILLIATERYSGITDWSSRDCVYFGDGAGAVIVGNDTGEITTRLYADGKSGEAFVCKTGDRYSIIGRDVFTKAMEVLPGAVTDILTETGLSISDITHVVPHQAGLVLVRMLMQSIGVSPDKCVTVMDKYANIASASIPIALNELYTPIPKQETLLLMTIGSGWTWGVAVIQQEI